MSELTDVDYVAQLMRRNPITVPPETTLRQALAVMNCRGIRHLVAVSQQMTPVGVISQRDILRHLLQNGSRNSRVSEAMSSPVVHVLPDLPLAKAAQVFCEKRIGCLPVVDPTKKLIGILTRSDFVRVVAAQDRTALA